MIAKFITRSNRKVKVNGIIFGQTIDNHYGLLLLGMIEDTREPGMWIIDSTMANVVLKHRSGNEELDLIGKEEDAST